MSSAAGNPAYYAIDPIAASYANAGGTSGCLGFQSGDQYATPTGSEAEFEGGSITNDASYGSPDLNCSDVSPATAPDAPVDPSVAVQGTTAYVDWAPPYNDGDSAVTGYTVTVTPSGQTATTTATETSFTDLSSTTDYTFTVIANNAVGSSSNTVATQVSPTAPGPPDSVTLSGTSGQDSATIEWLPPLSLVGDTPNILSGYSVSLQSDGTTVAGPVTVGPDDLQHVFTGLALGSRLTASVTATNRFGSSPTTSSAAITVGQPEQPDDVSATPGDGSISLSWSTPSSAPDSYSLSATPSAGGATVSSTVFGSQTSGTVVGLTDDVDYLVSVTAHNAYGDATAQYDGDVLPEAAQESVAAFDAPTGVAADGTSSTDEGSGATTDVVAPPVSPDYLTAPNGSTTTESWDADAVDAPHAVSVVTSTDTATTALSGAVVDDGSGSVVVGATVSLAPSDGGAGASASTTTDSSGQFAFAGVPATATGTMYDVTVSSGAAFGTYRLLHDTLQADEPYELTVPLTTSDQTIDDQGAAAPSALLASSAGVKAYPSNRAIPPGITVGRYPLYLQNTTDSSGTHFRCDRKGTSVTPQTYSWRYYILQVAANEIGYDDGDVAWKANVEAQSTFAWSFAINPRKTGADGYDITNAANVDQCFIPGQSIPSKWYHWVADIFQHRIANKSGIVRTHYASGKYSCAYDAYLQSRHELSQLGAKALAQKCKKYTAWADIDNYYYSAIGTVHASSLPPTPTHAVATPQSGAVAFSFQSTSGTSSVNQAWSFKIVQKYVSGFDSFGRPLYSYKTVYNKGWNSSSKSVPTNFAFKTSDCAYYKVAAGNPKGETSYTWFNNEASVCPS